MTDHYYMKRAIELARKGEGRVNPNPLVGAVVVKNGHVISEGWHHNYGGLHAEREALRALKEPAQGATIYVTLEPCCHYGKQPPCTAAIIEHGISRVVIGSRDPNPAVSGKGARMLREHGIIVVEDFMREECDALNPIYFHYITTGRPYVKMKYAMTADGKIATKTGDSKWITSAEARDLVHKWRNACMGIMAGIGTVLADDPMLNCRVPSGKNPVRIICDSRLRIPEDSQICRTAAEHETIVVCALPKKSECWPEDICRKADILRRLGVEVWNVPVQDDGVDLWELTMRLGQRGIDSILLEGGGTLNESALRAGIVQEINAFVAPMIFGGRARSPVEGIGIEVPNEALQLKAEQIKKVGKDLLVTYRTIQDWKQKR